MMITAIYVGAEHGRPYAAVAMGLAWIGFSILVGQITGGKL